MITYTKRGEYRCALLEEGDFEIYKTLCLHYDGMDEDSLSPDDLKSCEDWHLALLHGDKPVGIGSVYSSRNQAYMDQLFIIPEYRGRHLADLLHQARLKLAAERTAFQFAVLDIRHDNTSALRAISRQHFTERQNKQAAAAGCKRFVYNLDQLRPGVIPPRPDSPSDGP